MARKRDTGKGEPYTPGEAEALAADLRGAYDAWGRSDEPSKIDVRAKVEWAGHVMPANDGKRRTRVDVNPTAMAKVRKAVEKFADAKGKAETARPAKSRTAKGWHAQLRELTEAKNGSAAADRAGLNPALRTLQNWLSDPDYPIRRGDRERIEKAYAELRDYRVTEAREGSRKAGDDAAEALTDAMRDKYGQNVRFRDVDDLRFE